MQPMPEFTWDYIVGSCQNHIEHLTEIIGQDLKQTYQTQENYRRNFEALLLSVERLREHPQLATNVPMMSLASLRWFPKKGYEVQVYYEVPKLQYEVTIRKYANSADLGSLIEQTYVHLSKLADTVISFIQKTESLS